MIRSKKTSEMVKMALFIALIILLSVTPLGYIPLGAVNATTIQMPVIIGAVLFGWKKGAVLGGVFGLTSLIKNTLQPNATSFVFSPFIPVFGEESGSLWAIVICLLPRIMIGVTAAAVFAGLSKIKVNKTFASAAAGFCGSLINTVLVMGGIYLFFGESYSSAKDIAYNTLMAAVSATITGAGITEAVVSAVVCGAVCTALFKYLKRNGN
ncbi:MAG: ECF transporter S component [Oscillospiraceae bacterium]|nr:ECF transporter S component [Oscillospiraceae bacterium]